MAHYFVEKNKARVMRDRLILRSINPKEHRTEILLVVAEEALDHLEEACNIIEEIYNRTHK